MLVDVRNFHISGKEFERRLDEVQITVNKNAIPNDPEKPFITSGVRVGTPAVTSRGFKEPEMVKIAQWMGLRRPGLRGQRRSGPGRGQRPVPAVPHLSLIHFSLFFCAPAAFTAGAFLVN